MMKTNYSNYYKKSKKPSVYARLLTFLIVLIITSPIFGQTFPSGFSQVSVATGISNPTAIAFSPDGRIFVTEQGGRLRVIKNGSILSTPAISLTVNSSGERGLIGITLDPNFTTNNFIYLYYTVPNPLHNRVSRFTLSGDVISPNTEAVILDLDPLSSATNHNGGAMHFGTDGKLYIAVGENANGANAQNLDTYLGKLLRVNPDGTVPSGNPFTTGTEQRKRVWAYGLRNPFTFDIHPTTGKLLVNDVGQNTWEEINDASMGGGNFGWPTAEGISTNSTFTNPIYVYSHGTGDGLGCAISGGTYFTPSTTNYPSVYAGKYFFMDYCNRWINYIDPNVSSPTRQAFATNIGGSGVYITTGPDGNLYYLSRTSGALYKIIYTTTAAPAITDQPDSITVSEGQSAVFTVSATGSAPLSYQWRMNGINIAGATSSTYRINVVTPSDEGSYTVVVSNSAGSVTSTAALLTVTAPDTPPTASITSPSTGTLYRAGDTIRFSGVATDPEDGTIPPSSFTWTVVFHHDTHVHDGPPVAQGTSSGSFIIPNSGETSANVFYRLYLVVSDSEGLKDSAFVDILPRTSTITLTTQPAGLSLTLDGQAVTTPVSVVAIEGMIRTIGAPSPQTFNNTLYEFNHWAHGGSNVQTIIVPENDINYTAIYNEAQLPSPWKNTDIGGVAVAGSARYSNGTFTVSGSGNDIWNSSDEFHYVYQPLSGNGEIRARVNSITNTNAWAKAGVMIRESLAANSKHAYVCVTAGNGTAFQRRVNTGGSSTHTGTSGNAPYWVRLVRSGNTFTAYKSSDGNTWIRIGSQSITMATTIYIGLAVTSHNDGILNTASFSNVSVQTGITAKSGSFTETDEVLVGPVPVENELKISFTAGETEEAVFEIRNANNEVILSEVVSVQQGDNDHIFYLNTLQPGVYYLVMNRSTGIETKKIIVTR